MKLLLIALSFLLTGFTHAAESSLLPPPPAPDIAAHAFVLMDYQSGQVLQALKPDERVEPASLTKLMTAYLTFTALKQGRLKPNQTLPVSEKAWRSEGSRMFLKVNSQVAVEDLMKGMIVQSGNDACVTLAEGIAGTEDAFVVLMNREAQRLGMRNTYFMNATGLPHAQHYSTARDLAILTAAIMRDFPEYYPLYSIKEYSYNNITQPNRNRLLWQDPYVDGVKTGHTESAGFCLVTSAKRGDMRLISVMLGTGSDNARTTESQKLLNYGFQFYDTVRLYAAHQPVTRFRVWKGSINELKVGFPYDYYVTVPKGEAAKLTASVESRQPLLAPLKAGQAVGTLKLALDGKPFRETPVVALQSADLAGIFGRGWDTMRLLFK